MNRIEPTFGGIEPGNIYSDVLPPAPEGKRSPKLAGPGRRYVGQMLDAIFACGLFILGLYSLNKLEITSEQAAIASIIIAAIYLILSDALPSGQSLGKKLLGMSVICKTSGKYCSLWQSFVRNILTPVIGIVDAVFILSKRRQRIGDMMAGTIVILK